MTDDLKSVRLDVYLDVACLFRTRSEAQRACRGGKVEVNRVSAKPHREVRIGDELVITRPLGRKQHVRIAGLAEIHIPKAEARRLYEDLTPPPTPDEVEMRRMARLARPFISPSGSPDKRDRRLLRKMRGKG
ncbi:MAG: RNA-binding S4 domain-containing protein [Acidobacteria bacterium]|nr:RNA-binding S4 domain-containing protein [Acidobacteriota bacterium]